LRRIGKHARSTLKRNDLSEVGRESPPDNSASEFGGSNSDADLEGFQSRLTVLIERAGGPGKFARRSGVSTRQLEKYRKGADPSRQYLVRLARGGGVSLDWLASGIGPSYLDGSYVGTLVPSGASDADEASEVRLSTMGDAARGGRYVRVPRYDVRASAGPGAVVETEGVIEYVLFDQEYLRLKLRLNPANLALIEAHGDSMADTIQSGDLMLVDTSVPQLRGDGIYAIAIGETLLVKRVVVRLDGGVLLKSDNPRYDPIEVPKRDLATLRIVGRVVWVGGEV
jgi:phage repressor protein C with HTH and peptisase S24 domain